MKNSALQYKMITQKLLLFIFTAQFLIGCSPEDIDENTANTIEEKNSLTDAEGLLKLVNASRADEGLSSLTLNNALNTAAFDHSIDMETNDYFSHTGLDGSSFSERTKEAGYTGSPRGENIALGQKTIEAVHNSWMTSDGHRANILSESITEMGLGRTGNYWTQIFGIAN